jgi:hypothetical protein
MGVVTKRILAGAILLSLLPRPSSAQSILLVILEPPGSWSQDQQSPLITTAEWQRRFEVASHRKNVADATIAAAVALAVGGVFLAIRGEHPNQCPSAYSACFNNGEIVTGLSLLATGAITGLVGRSRQRSASTELDWLHEMRKIGAVKVSVGVHSVAFSIGW